MNTHIKISESVISLEKGTVTVNVIPLYNKARKRLEKQSKETAAHWSEGIIVP